MGGSDEIGKVKNHAGRNVYTTGSIFACLFASAIMQLYTHCIFRLSLRVHGLTCDGLSANRRFFKLHDPSSKIVYKVPNPYAEDGRQLYFSDPPHLLKTTRNGWASTKRRLWVCTCINILFHCNVHVLITQCNGREILWDHLEDLYKKDGVAHRNAAGLRLVPKLKYEHVFLTSYSKMRVDLAAQVCTCIYVYA